MDYYTYVDCVFLSLSTRLDVPEIVSLITYYHAIENCRYFCLRTTETS